MVSLLITPAYIIVVKVQRMCLMKYTLRIQALQFVHMGSNWLFLG